MATTEKRKREVISIGEKLKIIEMVEVTKKRVSDVARTFHKNESSIRQILRNKDRIRQYAHKYPRKLKIPDTERSKLMFQIEVALSDWLNDMEQQCITVDKNNISKKALELYEEMKRADPKFEEINFLASKSWLRRFLTKYKLQPTENITEMQFDCKDNIAAEISEFPDFVPSPPCTNNPASALIQFQHIVASERYDAKQIFCVNETNLYWKKLPNCASVQKYMEQAGNLCYKDRLTLTFCCNAAGHMIKPAVIYRKQNPCALSNKYKNSLPVFWQSNSRMRVTAALFLEWFHMCFIPEVKQYLAQEQLTYKILLVVNEAVWHPASLVTENEHVQILFLPADVAFSLQPLNKEIMLDFKANYLRHILHRMQLGLEDFGDFNILQFWQSFSLVDALLFIKAAVNDIESDCIKAAWQSLYGNEMKMIESRTDLNNLLQVAKQISVDGFSSMSRKALENYLAAHDEALSADDIKQLKSSVETDEEEENEDENNAVTGWTIEQFGTIFRLAHDLKNKLKEYDPIMERSMQINKQITASLAPMQKLFNELKRLHQPPMAITNPIHLGLETYCNQALIDDENYEFVDVNK